jgi:hypothetical protein
MDSNLMFEEAKSIIHYNAIDDPRGFLDVSEILESNEFIRQLSQKDE